MVLRHIWQIRNAIDGTGRCKNKTFDSSFLCRNHQGLEGFKVDRSRKALIKFEAGVVGNTGQVQHGILAHTRLGNSSGVSYIALDDPQFRVIFRQVIAAVPNKDIEDGDIPTFLKQLRYQHTSAVPGATNY